MSENLFDPSSFTIGGFMDGKKGTIRDAAFTTFDYNGSVDPPANVLKITLLREDDYDRTEYYSTGAVGGTEDGARPTRALNSGCRAAAFLKHLKESGYPMEKLGNDITNLVGAEFEWKHVVAKGSDKDFAVPAKYLGGSTPEEVDTKAVAAAVIEAVQKSGGSLKKSKLISAVGDSVPLSDRALLLNEEFLSSIDGLNYDNGVLSA